jgi:hypothetical protein
MVKVPRALGPFFFLYKISAQMREGPVCDLVFLKLDQGLYVIAIGLQSLGVHAKIFLRQLLGLIKNLSRLEYLQGIEVPHVMVPPPRAFLKGAHNIVTLKILSRPL